MGEGTAEVEAPAFMPGRTSAALFYEVDEQMGAIPKHPEAHLWPSEVVTLGLLHALKGGGNRAFYRWLTRDYRALFPQLPERTRLFRLFRTHHDWTQAFLATPTVLGVIDTYGIELIHPMREGRSPQQIGRKGLSNHRWIVGGKLLSLSRLNHWLPRGQAHPEVVQGKQIVACVLHVDPGIAVMGRGRAVGAPRRDRLKIVTFHRI